MVSEYHLISEHHRMKSGHSILSIITLLFSISSCIRPADLETGEMSVVVNCILHYPSPTQTLTLAYSIPNGMKIGPMVDKAEVSLFDLTDGAVAGTFAPTIDGEWKASIAINPGHQYRLDVDVPGENHISATTTLPECKEMCYRPNGIAMWVSDMASSSLNRSLCSTEYDLSVFDTPAWMYIWNYNPATGSHMVADLIAGNGQVDGFNRAGSLMDLDTEWKKHAFEYARAYHNKYLRYEPGNGGNTFIAGEMTAPFFTALGKASTIHPTIDNPVTLYAKPSVIPVERMGYVVLISVSKEYDRYLRDIITRNMKEDGDDITILYDREQIYSNIDGGVGIFGAKLTYYLPWDEPID